MVCAFAGLVQLARQHTALWAAVQLCSLCCTLWNGLRPRSSHALSNRRASKEELRIHSWRSRPRMEPLVLLAMAPGDMLRSPQLVYDKAEEMAERWREKEALRQPPRGQRRKGQQVVQRACWAGDEGLPLKTSDGTRCHQLPYFALR